jgi:hypothetical protein
MPVTMLQSSLQVIDFIDMNQSSILSRSTIPSHCLTRGSAKALHAPSRDGIDFPAVTRTSKCVRLDDQRGRSGAALILNAQVRLLDQSSI